MASKIEQHPEKDRIIDMLLAGESLRKISESVFPAVTPMSLHRYKRSRVTPALKNARLTAKALKRDGLSAIAAKAQAEELAKQDVMDAPIIAAREKRVQALHDWWERLRKLATERGADMPDVPGGSTGLLVRRHKSIGSGENAREVEEYELDGVLLKEYREFMKQAAQELGQWEADKAGSGTALQVNIVMPAVQPREQGEVIDIPVRR